MKPRACATGAAAAMLLFVVAVSGPGSSAGASAAAAPASAAVLGCSEVELGASEPITACVQGYKGAHGTLAAACLLGVGEITGVERERDCKLGYMEAMGVTATAPAATSAATSACSSITSGASDGSPAACAQGYQDALAGKSLEESCEHLGDGAIKAFEYETACEDGWFVAKNEPACIPGVNPMNSQQGSTIVADEAVDKECAHA